MKIEEMTTEQLLKKIPKVYRLIRYYGMNELVPTYNEMKEVALEKLNQ